MIRLACRVALTVTLASGLLTTLGVVGTCQELMLKIPLGLIEPDLPVHQPFTQSMIDLGKKIFFDNRLSRSGDTSCGTCHNPAFGYAERRPVSISDTGREQRRNAPSLLNVGFMPTLMWDGRFKSLEQQAIDPFKRTGDMGIELGDAMDIIANDAEYLALFGAARLPLSVEGFTRALSSFQRSLLSGNTPFDRYVYGADTTALTPVQIQGLEVFAGKGSCISCHDVFHRTFNPLGGGVALFSDFRFHNLGVSYRSGQMQDTGRYYTTRSEVDWGAFRTPSLRNAALTAPYMHDGSLATLEDVINFYDDGGRANPKLSSSMRPLLLSTVEKIALRSFLDALTDPEVVKLAADSLQSEAKAMPGLKETKR